MVSFNQKDVIFLLNKWDTLLDDDDKITFYENTQTQIRKIWKEVKSERIMKMSMNKV